MSSLNWRARSACVPDDLDLFYPDKYDDPTEAKEVCAACPVKLECRSYARENREPFGIWGGETEGERAAYLRKNNPGQPQRPNEPTDHYRCGTYSGVSRHRKDKEALCDPCRAAKSAYEAKAKLRRREALLEEIA